MGQVEAPRCAPTCPANPVVVLRVLPPATAITGEEGQAYP